MATTQYGALTLDDRSVRPFEPHKKAKSTIAVLLMTGALCISCAVFILGSDSFGNLRTKAAINVGSEETEQELKKLHSPKDFNEMTCDRNKETYEPALYTELAYPEDVLYSVCYKANLCCTGYQSQCLDRINYGEQCRSCLSNYGPARLKAAAQGRLASGNITRRDLEKPENFEEFWGVGDVDTKVLGEKTFGAACWDAVDFCHQQCPRDRKDWRFENCAHCIENFAHIRDLVQKNDFGNMHFEADAAGEEA